MAKRLRVLIVDDSAVVRNTLREIFESDPMIEVMGTATDPFAAVQKIKGEVPDVIILDVEMPRMDGITFLRRIMAQRPIPVVICSSLAEEGGDVAMRALGAGAVDVIQKPRLGTGQFLLDSRIRLCDAVKAAAQARLSVLGSYREVVPKYSADVVLPKYDGRQVFRTTETVVMIGASTGGTEALRIFLQGLPPDSPGIVIVQHMPEHFTSSFARRLNQCCAVTVKEAEDDDTVIRGRALIAPGNRHTLLKRSGVRYCVEVKDGPLVSRHRPSVDVLFRSAARYAGKNAVGIIMTGMGDDGALGIQEMKASGAHTIAQDETTSVVFGMPHEAIKRGCIDQILPLQRIAGEVIRLCG